MEGDGALRRWTFRLIILGTLLTIGCAQRAPAPPPGSSPKVSPPSVSSLPHPSLPIPSAPVSPADRAYEAGLSALSGENYEIALEMFAAAWKENPGHPGVARDFPEALISLKKSGDQAMKQGRLEDAGRRWEATTRYMSHPAEKGRPLPFTKTELRGGIDRLSASLMEKGLVEYRKGNLEAAIVFWRSILAYDPSHAEAARSVQTASTQLENLKKIAPPPK